MIAKGPRYVWTVFDGGEMDEDEGVMVDICISVLVRFGMFLRSKLMFYNLRIQFSHGGKRPVTLFT